MSDRLKKYIEDNADHFEVSPSAGHFERFKQKQQFQAQPKQETKSALPVFMKIAAVLVVVFGIGWLFFNLGKIQGAQEFAQTPSTASIFTNELAEAEMFFTAKVDQKKKELLAYSSTDNEDTKQILLELDKLELQYIDLKDELIFNNNNAQIINAMIENYRVRLSLLERLLKQLKKSEQLKQKHHVEIQA